MANRLRHRSNWTLTENGKQLLSLPTDTGNMTYTESFQAKFNLAAGSTYTGSIGPLTEGNHIWIKATTGRVYVCFEAGAITRTNSISLLSGGQLMLTKGTFASVKFKNTNSTTTTTIEYWVAGD